MKKIKEFLDKEIDRITVNPKKEGLIVAFLLFFFTSIPIALIFEGNKTLLLIVNLIYSIIAYISIYLCNFVYNKLLFKDKWTYKREFFSVFTMYFYCFVFIYIIDTFAIMYFEDLVIRKTQKIYKLFLVAVTFGTFIYAVLAIYRLIFKKNTPIKNSLKYISINYKSDIHKVNNEEIISIEAYGNYIKIYLLNKNITENVSKPIVIRQTLKNISDIIDKNEIKNLVKCHRSYIVNINMIVSIKKETDKKQYLQIEHIYNKKPLSKNKVDYFKDILIDNKTIIFT